jgi:ABC-type phosphate transport system, periplasmic component
MKKIISTLLIAVMAVSMFAACDQNSDTEAGFNTDAEIAVVSREDGSGTRGAFIELFGIEQRNDDGTRKDLTTKEAIIARATDVMMANIVNNQYAIGYVSMGSLNDTVKAVQIEGVEATTANVVNGTYPIMRPFNIATNGTPSEVAQDFIDFILSAEGQAVVSQSYIAVANNAPAFSTTQPSGTIVIAGSSSVTPVMEKLAEAYKAINPNANIEIQQTDSSAGMTSAIEGTCDIGMASRELKESELEVLTSTQIALDGIAVIVNVDSPIVSLTKDEVKAIFTGEVLVWSDVI